MFMGRQRLCKQRLNNLTYERYRGKLYFTSIDFTCHILIIFLSLSLILTTASASNDNGKPTIVDTNLKVERVFSGLDFPTTMTFIGPNDILVLEKETGTVQRITDGKLSDEPMLDANVSYMKERGMLGIAIPENQSDGEHRYVFLYYTKSQTDDDDNIDHPIYNVSNYLYRYELVNNTKLSNPKLLLTTPAAAEPFHVGGKILIGPENNVYVTMGDQTKFNITQAQNIRNGPSPDKTGGILRITQNGHPVEENVLGNEYPLNLYYAYGIRNSFGIDFDPVTGKLWDTENGPYYGDEINLVEPGFNSGWSKVQGIWTPSADLKIGDTLIDYKNLEDFGGKGKYSAPEFVWKKPACPAPIKFLDSGAYGKQYENDLFVGTTLGKLYHFDLNKNRTELVLKNTLQDKIADTNTDDELAQIEFGERFGEITDMQVGPHDKLLYILSLDGSIYRIVPK